MAEFLQWLSVIGMSTLKVIPALVMAMAYGMKHWQIFVGRVVRIRDRPAAAEPFLLGVQRCLQRVVCLLLPVRGRWCAVRQSGELLCCEKRDDEVMKSFVC